MNHQQRRNKRSFENKLNNMIRQFSCWNCLQLGHRRFQCPYVKMQCCSFCRKPSVLTVNCGCELSVLHVDLHSRRRKVKKPKQPQYENHVIVPQVNEQNGSVEYKEDANIVVYIDNDQEKQNEESVNDDILEIHADDESLENI